MMAKMGNNRINPLMDRKEDSNKKDKRAQLGGFFASIFTHQADNQ